MVLDLGSVPVSVDLAYPDGSNRITVPVTKFKTQDSHLGEDGLIKTTGLLSIPTSPIDGFAESLDPEINPLRFARGCQVISKIAYTPGSWIAHPRARLRVLKTPTALLGNEPVLEIQIGCVLSLLNYRKLPSDDTEIPLGTYKFRYELIQALASKLGISSFGVYIEEYPINYPILTEGGYVATMGRIAWDAGYVLWINNQEELVSIKAGINPTRPDLRVKVGTQEVQVKAIAAEETATEIIRAVGVAPDVKATENPKTIYAKSSDLEFNPSSRRKTVFLGFGSNQVATHTTQTQPRGRVFPALFPGSTRELRSLDHDTYWYYDSEPEGLLRYKKEKIRQPKGVIFPSQHPGNSSPTDAKEILTRYYYEDDATIRIEKLTYEPASIVSGIAPLYLGQEIRDYGLALSEWVTQAWRLESGVWIQSSEVRKYKRGEQSRAETSFSGAGSTTPPAPERRTEPFNGEEKQFSGEVRFPPIVGAGFQEIDREYDVHYPVSEEHCQDHARLEGTLLHGRQSRVNWILPVGRLYPHTYKPLMIVDWTFINGVVKRHMMDGVGFFHNATSGVFGGDSINFGQVKRRSPPSGPPPGENIPDPAEYLVPPFAIAATLKSQYKSRSGLFAPDYPLVVTGSLISVMQSSGTMIPNRLEVEIVNLTTAVINLVASPIQVAIASTTTAAIALAADVFLTVEINNQSTAGVSLSADARLVVDIASTTTAAIALATGPIGVTFTYVSGGDTNGLFYYLGTNRGLVSWQNPYYAGRLTITASSFGFGTTVAELVDRNAGSIFTTANVAGGWFEFDLGGYKLTPSKYSLKTRDYVGNCPTAFKLQGSNDYSIWIDLDTRSTPTWVPLEWNTYSVAASTAYRYLRFTSLGLDSAGANLFLFAECELYGVYI